MAFPFEEEEFVLSMPFARHGSNDRKRQLIIQIDSYYLSDSFFLLGLIRDGRAACGQGRRIHSRSGRFRALIGHASRVPEVDCEPQGVPTCMFEIMLERA
jgi:predicted hydrocarbon binding protein